MKNRQVFIDTETTGLSARTGHRIIELAAVEAVGGELTGRVFHTYLDPERSIDPGAQRVHGISASNLKGKPKFRDIAHSLREFISGAECLMHNAAFDKGFIDAEFERTGLSERLTDLGNVTCTMLLARSRYPGESASLDALIQRAGLGVTRNQHSALEDAKLLAAVYLGLLSTHASPAPRLATKRLDPRPLTTDTPIQEPTLPSKLRSLEGRKGRSHHRKMGKSMNIVELLTPHFERYITINGVVPGKAYNYAARDYRNLPVVDVSMHRPKCGPDSWLYVAVRATGNLAALLPEDKLYVGSQTPDRMFRGDGMQGRNFHHAEMRNGNGDRNLISYLKSGGKVDIHRISARGIERSVTGIEKLQVFAPLLRQPDEHIGYWFEQAILLHEVKDWAWNKQGAKKPAKQVIEGLFSDG